jgi:PAS domain S-box-containing protein
MDMNLFALISFITAFGSFLLSFLVYSRDPKNKINFLFMIFGVSVTYLGITELGYRLATNSSTVFFWEKIASFSPFAVALLYHFIVYYTNNNKMYKPVPLLIIAYFPAGILSLVDVFMESPTTAIGLFLGQTKGFKNSLWLQFDMAWTTILLLLVLYFSYNFLRICRDREMKLQARFITFGLTIPILIALITEVFLPVLGFDIPEMTLLGFAIADAVIGFAIWKFQLFKITPDSAANKIISTMTDALFLTDADGIIQESNNAVGDLLDYKDLDIRNHNIGEFFDTTRAARRDLFWETGENPDNDKGKFTDIEATLITRTSERIPVSLAVAPLTDTKDNLKGYVLIGRDIRERKASLDALERAREELEIKVRERTAELASANSRLVDELDQRLKVQDALSQEKERLAVTLRSIGDGVIATDTSAKIVFLNYMAEKLTGWSTGEAEGKKFKEIFRIYDEDTDEQLPDPIEQIIKTNSNIELSDKTVLSARDGLRRRIADSGSPIRNNQGVMIGCVIVFRDITERQKMEEELRRAQKLESVGVLAGGIAHDFNNILTGIINNLFLAKTGMNTNQDAYRLVNDAEEAAFRASRLTQQLLTFAKGGVPVKKVYAIRPLIEESIGFYLSGSRVDYTLEFAENLLSVEVDRGQFEQVMSNLLINAEQAMPNGGTVEVKTENRAFLVEGINHDPFESSRLLDLKPGYYVKISISDNGPGIPAEIINKIFDPYFSTKEKGSGLGLSIVYSIIKQHGGYIAVDSQPGKGSVFAVYLPASNSDPVSETKAISSQLSGKKAHILIMDDEISIRNSISELLKKMGYEATVAREGREAIKLYADSLGTETQFDIVILDLTVPGGMGGEECMLHLRKLNPDVCAIVSSGYSNSSILSGHKVLGFKDVLVKPYRIEELTSKINALL